MQNIIRGGLHNKINYLPKHLIIPTFFNKDYNGISLYLSYYYFFFFSICQPDGRYSLFIESLWYIMLNDHIETGISKEAFQILGRFVLFLIFPFNEFLEAFFFLCQFWASKSLLIVDQKLLATQKHHRQHFACNISAGSLNGLCCMLTTSRSVGH